MHGNLALSQRRGITMGRAEVLDIKTGTRNILSSRRRRRKSPAICWHFEKKNIQ